MKRINEKKNILISILVVFILIVLPLYYLYRNINSIIIREAGVEAEKIATTISIFIEEDIDIFKRLVEAQDLNDYEIESYYNNTRKVLYKIRKNTNSEYIYIKRKNFENNIVYIIDGEDENSENFSPFGSIDRLSQYVNLVYDTNSNVSTGIESYDRWGKLVTGYAPINDINGEVIGLVGVDISLNKINKLRYPINKIIVIGGGIISLIGIFSLNSILNTKSHIIERDYLTGLLNRRSFEGYLEKAVKKSKDKEKKLSLIMIDVDEFKDINDKYGHLIGDKVLKNIGRLILESTRESDFCFRFGGDEFIIILPYTDKKEAIDVGNRIKKNIQAIMNLDTSMENIDITLSMGVAEWKTGMDIRELVDLADKNMYISKSMGKNKIT